MSTGTKPAVITSDDVPDGERPRLVISAGGNLDWYLQIEGTTWGGKLTTSDGIRFCTSGARSDINTMLVAALHASETEDWERLGAIAGTLKEWAAEKENGR